MYVTFTFPAWRAGDEREEIAMSYSDTASQGPRANWGCGQSGRGFGRQHCGARWTLAELLAMILGFIVFWPIGLAVLAWKFWQRKSGYRGDFATMVQEKMAEARGFARQWEGPFARSGSGSGGWGMRQTGNAIFDEWRAAELARLEEERRKLEAAERDFADYIANLRRARDREEFERFMNERRTAGSSRPEGGPQA
jgi:hypothetical protein